MGEHEAGGRPGAMDDPRWEPGMPVLDRQAVREHREHPTLAQLAAMTPRSVPETAPTPLQRQYINLSAILLLTTGDATLRIARSARAWMAVDPGRGWFRVAWVIASCVLLALIVTAMVVVLRA